jgi:hypothetical protein
VNSTTPPQHAFRPDYGADISGCPPDARIAGITSWLGQFSRVLKTCRLYDARSHNTIRCREELGTAMLALLGDRGALRLEFSAHQIHSDRHPVMVSRPGEDSFVMPFYRDGLRTLTFNPDAEAWELDVIVDLLLRVTSRVDSGGEDLVTLLWAAGLPHIDMSYVDSETDADMGDESDDFSPGEPTPANSPVLPWPGSGGSTPGEGTPTEGQRGTGRTGLGATAPATGEPAGATGWPAAAAEVEQPDSTTVSVRLRSDDWLAGEPAGELDERYLALDATRIADLDRFAAGLRQDRGCSLVQAALGLVRDALGSSLLEGDRADLTDLLERALQDAIAGAGWPDAREVVDCLTELTEGRWHAAPLIEQLARADSPVTGSLVRYLDEQTVADDTGLVEFARRLGPVAVGWLMSIVALASHERTRRTLMATLTAFCEGHPELLAPWLTDERWHVVRNAVCIMGATAGGAPPALLRPLVHHPEPCVRQEVIAALANTDIEAARPLLLALIHDSEASIRRAVLRRLGSQRHPRTSAALIAIVLDPGFRKRPVEEVRAVTTALGGCAGDEALPHLEPQLYAPRWFSMGEGPHCQMIARCIMRIGTPAARAMLERGACSRVAATRDACRLALRTTAHA